MRNYTFRRLTEADLPLVRQWLDMAHVRVWWPDAEKQIALMQQDMDNSQIDMWLVEMMGQPFGYLHDHDAQSFGMPQYADLPRGTRVISTFVGDAAFVGPGYSVGYISARVRDLRIKHTMIAAGPNATDTRSVSIYSQAGFKKRRLAPTRDARLLQIMTHH